MAHQIGVSQGKRQCVPEGTHPGPACGLEMVCSASFEGLSHSKKASSGNGHSILVFFFAAGEPRCLSIPTTKHFGIRHLVEKESASSSWRGIEQNFIPHSVGAGPRAGHQGDSGAQQGDVFFLVPILPSHGMCAGLRSFSSITMQNGMRFGRGHRLGASCTLWWWLCCCC